MSHHQPEGETGSSRLPSPHERQQELLHGIGRELASVAPTGWYRVDLRVYATASVDHLSLAVLMRDGSYPPVDPPLSVGRMLRELRTLMYEEGRGTWFSLRYTLDPPLEYHASFNYDFDPKWFPDIPAEAWAQDLEVFPRDPENVPGWLRAKLPHQSET